jgi:hypothetical protein
MPLPSICHPVGWYVEVMSWAFKWGWPGLIRRRCPDSRGLSLGKMQCASAQKKEPGEYNGPSRVFRRQASALEWSSILRSRRPGSGRSPQGRARTRGDLARRPSLQDLGRLILLLCLVPSFFLSILLFQLLISLSPHVLEVFRFRNARFFPALPF